MWPNANLGVRDRLWGCVSLIGAGAASLAFTAIFGGEGAAAIRAFPGKTIQVGQDFGLEEAFPLDADAVVSTAFRTNWFHLSETFLSFYLSTSNKVQVKIGLVKNTLVTDAITNGGGNLLARGGVGVD